MNFAKYYNSLFYAIFKKYQRDGQELIELLLLYWDERTSEMHDTYIFRSSITLQNVTILKLSVEDLLYSTTVFF